MFKLITVVVTALDETTSLQETVRNVIEGLDGVKFEIVISTSRLASPNCVDVARRLCQENSFLRLYFHTEPHVAAAILEVVKDVNSEFVAFMSSDGETPAEALPRMLKVIGNEKVDIVVASRWLKESKFIDYGLIKKFVSFCAQRVSGWLYRSNLTEFTFGYRIYKTTFLQKCKFVEKKHPFFLESLLVPLRLGASVKEVPVVWQPRTQGESVSSIRTIISYIRPLILVRIRRIHNLLIEDFT